MDVKEEPNASPPRDSKANLQTVLNATLNPVQSGFGEILSCAYHRDVIIQLSTILQVGYCLTRFLPRLCSLGTVSDVNRQQADPVMEMVEINHGYS